MNVLVTGATGLIGSRLCLRLAKEGHTVQAMVHRTVNPVLENVPGIEIVYGDLCNRNSLYDNLVRKEPVDTVFHLGACLPHVPATMRDFRMTNVGGTRNLLHGSDIAGVRRFVYASTMSVYSSPPTTLPVSEHHQTEPTDIYGVTKRDAERLCWWCATAGLTHVTILRYSSVFGVGDTARVAAKFVSSAFKGQDIRIDGVGGQSSDFIHVDDAVNGTMLAWQHGQNRKPYNVYNIGSGRETTIRELANLIADFPEHPVDVVLSGEPATRPHRFVADISKARKELLYEPGKLEDRLKQYWIEYNKAMGEGYNDNR